MTADTSVVALTSAVRHIAPVFQPVLWLDDLTVAGYEALARGPESTPFALPLDLLAAARTHGVVGELESAMTCAAIDAVLDRPWDRSVTLFANIEPQAMATPPLPAAVHALERAEADGVRVVVEITERSLLAHPAALIAASTAIRSRGWGVAMDDAGAGDGDETLTLLWVLQPDIVKVDMSILHGPFDARAARVSATVRDYCDRTSALMVCEGVETAAHEARARALGADMVQGFRYAMPTPRPDHIPPTPRPVEFLTAAPDEPASFSETIAQQPVATLSGSEVEAIAEQLLSIVSTHTDSAVVLTSAPSAADVPDAYLDVLSALAPSARLVALIAPGCPGRPATGVLGVDTDAGLGLGTPWSIIVVAPTMAAAILSESFAGDESAAVEFRILHHRPTVAHAARVLLSHIPTTEALATTRDTLSR